MSMWRWWLVVLAVMVVPAGAAAQRATLRSGPMVGYSEMREVMLWTQTTGPATVQIVYWDTAAPDLHLRTRAVRTVAESAYVAKLVADRVEPGRRYAYEILVDGRRVARPYPLRFRTQELWQWRHDPPAFRIAIGSCAYVNEPPYDRPGEPYGAGYEIFRSLHAARPDLMIWLGDNTYLREVDWYSRTGILARYTHTRALPELQPLLGSVHHYAIWDDHDYGPDDADRTFRDKHLTREAFRLFWANPPATPDGLEGITTTFEWADVQFFLLDDRWYRSPLLRAGERAMLGERQVEWLVEALASSRATFRFVVIGSQVLNPVPDGDGYASYPEERDRLLERIRAERIPGVIFLTGDVHHTALTRLDRPGTYPLYDLTVSPLTAGPRRRVTEGPEYLHVPGTLVAERNFATIDISGPRSDRRLVIRVYDVHGTERWTREIRASELRDPS